MINLVSEPQELFSYFPRTFPNDLSCHVALQERDSAACPGYAQGTRQIWWALFSYLGEVPQKIPKGRLGLFIVLWAEEGRLRKRAVFEESWQASQGGGPRFS